MKCLSLTIRVIAMTLINKLLNDVLESGYLVGGPNINAVEEKSKNTVKSKTTFV